MIRIKPVQLHESDRKLAELMLYISRISEADASFGRVKLNKLLFFADFSAYRKFGKSITGQDYKRRPNGPCPARFLPVKKELELANAIVEREEDYYGRKQIRIIAVREPDLTLFSGPEIALVAKLVQTSKERSATALSDLSHRFSGWKLAGDGEIIPYEAALITRRKLKPAEVEHARSIEERAVARLADTSH